MWAGYVTRAHVAAPLCAALSCAQVVQQITGVVQGGGLGDAAQPDKAPHVFQALLYLRKLCSHPLLVLDPQQPQHLRALAAAVGHRHGGGVSAAGAGAVDLDWAQAQLHTHLHHAPKLLALQELLLDCGIGREPGAVPVQGPNALRV
jgi:TATA-binding protein-associated factor